MYSIFSLHLTYSPTRSVCFSVVALFNAIAKAKRDTVAAEEATISSKKERAEAAAKDDTENSSMVSRERALQASKMSVAGKKGASKEEEEGKGGWAALRDDYMVGQQLTVKVNISINTSKYVFIETINCIVIDYFNLELGQGC
jgi:hypothetical protein